MTPLRRRPYWLAALLLAAIGRNTAFVPVPPPRQIATVALPVLSLSTQNAAAMEVAKQADPNSMELGQVPVTYALPLIAQVVGFAVAALYASVKEDVKGVKEDVKGVKEDLTRVKEEVTELRGDVKDLNGKFNALVFFFALGTGVGGYAVFKP